MPIERNLPENRAKEIDRLARLVADHSKALDLIGQAADLVKHSAQQGDRELLIPKFYDLEVYVEHQIRAAERSRDWLQESLR